jgi:hypothetical protein
MKAIDEGVLLETIAWGIVWECRRELWVLVTSADGHSLVLWFSYLILYGTEPVLMNVNTC